MKPYPQYKDLEIEWIGLIPENWKTIKFKFITTLMTCGHAATPEYVDSIIGIPFLSAQNIKNEQIDLHKYNHISKELHHQLTKNHRVEKGDLLQVRVGGASTIGSTAISNIDFEYSIYVSLSHIKLNAKAYNGYIKHLCNSGNYREVSSLIMKKGAGVANFNVSDQGKIKIPLPPLPEQKQIVRYLDHKTTKIDFLIEKKKRLIKLLKEERTAVINQAVTKGLDPNVPMKDSGIEWLGEIPEHWEVKKIKYVLNFFDHIRVPLSSDERGRMPKKVYDYYGASGIIDKVEDYLFDGEYILVGEDGANLLTRSTPLAFKAAGKFWVNNHAHILHPKNGTIDYFVNFLECIDYSICVSGAAQPKLTQERLGSIKIVEPPLKEQNIMSKHIEKETSRIGTIITKSEKEIELLQEYRTALISEVVTGKIDVREEKI